MTSQSDDGSVDFRKVYFDELTWIQKRRELLRSEGLTHVDAGTQPAQIAPDSKSELHPMQADALRHDLCGLAISGGGIRSATFALGVLQGLASIGLLSRFDYLSTVSGGGYIGAWFSALANRIGFKTVVDTTLVPPRLQATPSPRVPFEVEPEPIRHLRLYSNYLAPHPGLFSFDGWALIAIYLRNLLLNQLILLFAVVSLISGMRAVVEVFSMANDKAHPAAWGTCLGSLILICLVWAIGGASALAPCHKGQAQSSGRFLGLFVIKFGLLTFWMSCIVPWILAAILISILLCNSQGSLPIFCGLFTIDLIGSALVLGVIHAALGAVAFSRPIRAMFSGVFTGLVGGAILFLGWSCLVSMNNGIPVAIIATFGVPLCLWTFVLTNFLMVGMCGPDLSEIEREWWSSLDSRLMMIGAGWLALFGTVIFSPWIVAKLASMHDFAFSAIGVSWLSLLLTGVKAAQSSTTGPSNKAGIKDGIARLAPPLFLITIVVVVSVLEYECYALLMSNPEWGFKGRLPQLLTDLNSPKPAIEFVPALAALVAASGILGLISHLLGKSIGVNTFSLQNLYANRLVRCYLGASRAPRRPNPLVNLALEDDLHISSIYPGLQFEVVRIAAQEQRIKELRSELSSKNTAPKRVAGLKTQIAELERLTKQANDRLKAKEEAGHSANQTQFHGPLHLINGALNQKAGALHNSKGESPAETNAEKLQFLERKASSFVFSPLYCGSEQTGFCPSSEFAQDVKLGTAVAVSGAAVSPNMGYHSSPAITALLTAFNIRLGAWFGNPRCKTRDIANPAASAPLLLAELSGMTDADSDYVYISDGGHFENMGVYELIRRRCRFILAIDAGADPKFHENVGRVVRQVRIDFGVWIEVDIAPASPDANGKSLSHMVVGRIHYEDVHKVGTKQQAQPPDSSTSGEAGSRFQQTDPTFEYRDNHGIIVWLKNSLTGDEPGDLVNYAAMNPAFPYDSTLNQFFNETQFESYRALGIHSLLKSVPLTKQLIDGSPTSKIFEDVTIHTPGSSERAGCLC